MNLSTEEMLRLLAVGALAFFAGWIFKPDSNSTPTFGDTGYPKNCKAIINDNIRRVQSKEYSAEEALVSIERNCGLYGHSWGR